MKLLHTTTIKLNTKEFNKVSEDIIDALYELSPEIEDIYDIHINFIKDNWKIDFLPFDTQFPVLSVDTYTENDDSGKEILRISPKNLADIPVKLVLGKEDTAEDLCISYIKLFEFVLMLYDFEYVL